MWTEEQGKKIISMLKHAQCNVPYYRELFDGRLMEGITYDEFIKIPLLDKKKIRERYSDLITEGVDTSSLIYESTSGSTGIPLRIPRTTLDRVRSSFPLTRRRRKWLGELPDLKRNASYSHRINDVVISAAEGWLGLWLRELTDENLQIQCEQLLDHRPQILAGPPQALVRLGQYILEHNIQMEKAKIGLVECRSEYLFEGQRQICERAFNCPAVNMYGCHEVWGIAYECVEHHLHIMEDSVLLEVLNELGEPVKENEIGEVIITGLCSQTMPIIRYKLGDKAIIHKTPCNCMDNTPFIELIGCRSTEWIFTPKGKVATAVFHPLITKLSQPEYDYISQFQMVQNDIDQFEFTVATNEKLPRDFELMIEVEMEKALGYPINVTVAINGNFKSNQKSLKLSWFYSEM